MKPLAVLLAEERRRHAPDYGGGLTNHLPMCLIALDRLGAGEERLRAFVDTYIGRLEPTHTWPRADARVLEVRSAGIEATIRAQLPALLPGLAGAAFHGLIRLAYAVMATDADEVGAALAYLEEHGQVLRPPARKATATNAELGELADHLRAARIPAPTHPTITERLREVAADARFAEVVETLKVDRTTLSQVSAHGARWYHAADDFASLHVLTAAHAARRLRPWVEDAAAIAACDHALAVGALACFVVSGSPARADGRGQPLADDKELKARAVASDDDHLAKLVVSALDEEKAMEDRIYRIVATRAARRGRA